MSEHVGTYVCEDCSGEFEQTATEVSMRVLKYDKLLCDECAWKADYSPQALRKRLISIEEKIDTLLLRNGNNNE